MNYEQQLSLINAAKELSSDYEKASGLYELWLKYNFEIFDGRLRPLIIMLADTSPYGSQLGHYAPSSRKIFIWDRSPKQRAETLLHEMAHQYQVEIMGAVLEDAHNCESWCDVWNDIILPATGYGQYCVTMRKRSKKLNRETGKRDNVYQLIWVPSCGDRIPVPAGIIKSMGHPHLYKPATEPWAKGYEPNNSKCLRQRLETLVANGELETTH